MTLMLNIIRYRVLLNFYTVRVIELCYQVRQHAIKIVIIVSFVPCLNISRVTFYRYTTSVDRFFFPVHHSILDIFK